MNKLSIWIFLSSFMPYCLLNDNATKTICEAYVTFNIHTASYEISNKPVEYWIAKGTLNNSISNTGWSYLEVQTNPTFLDKEQAYAAGIVEGYLTHDLIYQFWYNNVKYFCVNKTDICNKMNYFINNNTNWMQLTMNSLLDDPYWFQVSLILQQLEGLVYGYNKSESNDTKSLNYMDFLWINLHGDKHELENAIEPNSTVNIMTKVGNGACSALIKILPGNKDLFTSHVTWNSSMTRILKNYVLKLHKYSSFLSSIIPGYRMTFSSYPGVLISLDDFTVISSELVTLETTTGNYNNNLWKFINPVGHVWEWIRVLVANRLSVSGKEWVSLFRLYNSGTYNNQWMIVDYKLFIPGSYLQNGLLWVLEQLPGYTHAEDLTDTLRRETYWPSYNLPYFSSIFKLGGFPSLVKTYGDWFTYNGTARALIFKRDHSKVVDIESMIRLMRYNNFTSDPLAHCECIPPYSAENAISARNDLNLKNGTYPFYALSHRAHGGTDMKLINKEMMSALEFIAISGPTYDSLPPFQWSSSDLSNDILHLGQPDLFKFEPVRYKWLYIS